MKLIDKLLENEATVCVMGVGYVGEALIEEFSKKIDVIGLDINQDKINRLNERNDKNNLEYTTNQNRISEADFILIAVPTPIKDGEPDLSILKDAASTVSENLTKNSVVVVESTVYPGATEEVVKPVLEKSGLVCGRDFSIGYSPERINPGDDEHTLKTITKNIAGYDEETTELLSKLYGKVCDEVYIAEDIRTAEAAKGIENIQRDLNIALMNELSLIFDRLDLDTDNVLEAAATKWNFHPYEPGLVGGHCIPVDPYYLLHKSKKAGYDPKIITAGREINNEMPEHIVDLVQKNLEKVNKKISDSKILILGLTYKENVADTRNSPAKKIAEKLKKRDAEVYGLDPYVKEIEKEFEIQEVKDIEDCNPDCTIVSVTHKEFEKITLENLKDSMKENPVLIDVRGKYNKEKAIKKGFYYKKL
ncbi:nucleotide sugar dehydrogenase [Methanonatronarchaeum sp. AMET-Sl]|uniref:nucleotide sugar dehydrogenase n=1 Tax=Methanonatronarchaeum sp. AMET-Sl TaxID=3037654 RepID=UPI00244DF160|nr:nucleotide sugar dehydrogenase [Methanonatronarchaeum sp. AMET-Sl]WGI17653.1 nucleotide sugar dehydrogenase [Methanonatronarchaeum sp. AMET-Sl]